MRKTVGRWTVNGGRLLVGTAVLFFGAIWRYQGLEGPVFIEAGRVPQLRAGDVVTAPLFLIAVGLIATAFVTSTRRQIIGGLLLGLGLAYPLFSFPWDGRVIIGQHHHGVHNTDALALVLLLGALIALMIDRSPRRRGVA
jgi:hypothetical protein